MIREERVREFWQDNSCGDTLVGGLRGAFGGDTDAFFAAYDNLRYTKEAHILGCLDQIDFRSKRVLEIGLGQGADSEQIIRRGALWSGIDLTEESVSRVRTRLEMRGLPYECIRRASGTAIPFPDGAFDIIYSHGVLHHIPALAPVEREMARVLKPGGELVAMLYARWSLNYLLAISVLRRLGLLAMCVLPVARGGVYGQHLKLARKMGVWRYLRTSNFLSRNTDGPLNPYSRVYAVADIPRAFPNFRLKRAHKHFLHAPPLPLGRLPFKESFESLLGWHLWVHLEKR